MEIDTIKTVPLSEDTVLWFEFLLKPELLDEYLKKKPTHDAIALMSEFLGKQIKVFTKKVSCYNSNQLLLGICSPSENNQQVNSDINSPESDSLNKIEKLSTKVGKKQLALKILSLKVASYFHFNLGTIEKNLPLLGKQVQLLSDLCSISSGRLVNLPLSLVHEVPLSEEGNKSALNFALTLYHRWLLRAHVLRGCIPKPKYPQLMIATVENPNIGLNHPDEKFFAGIEPFTPTSIEFLHQVMNDPEPFTMLTYDSFIPLDERSAKVYRGQKFEKSVVISKTELRAQIYYDLCAYHVFIKKYDVAKEMIRLCRDNLSKLKKEFAGRLDRIHFCTVTDDDLQGYLLACGICETMPVSLIERLNQSLLNNFKNIEEILNEDNVKCEIPFVSRKLVESEMESTAPENLKIVALNTIRLILHDDNVMIADMNPSRLVNSSLRLQFLKYFIQVRFEYSE